ncbi:hypothetical protein XvhCFBP2543_22420, partial [Xanthomonas vasicola]
MPAADLPQQRQHIAISLRTSLRRALLRTHYCLRCKQWVQWVQSICRNVPIAFELIGLPMLLCRCVTGSSLDAL